MKMTNNLGNELQIRAVLLRIIHTIVGNSHLRDDLMQEAMLHLSEQERDHPGQTRSWYIQSCRFHVLHQLRAGYSLDSTKRRQRQAIARDQLSLTDAIDAKFVIQESPANLAITRDLLDGLYQRLNRLEGGILKLLVDGFGVREIASELKISHQAVSKHRQHIGMLAVQLGVSN